MLKPVALFIGLRYTRARRKNHFISFISLVSMLGIALGVMILITVMSVMNGFESELRNRILGMTPHVIVGDRRGGLKDWEGFSKQLLKRPDVVAAAPFIQTQGMLRAHGLNQYGFVQGVDPAKEAEVSIVADHMREGALDSLKAGEWNIVLGDKLARNLGLFIGDKVTVIVVEGTNVSPAGILPRYRRFTLTGTFEVRAEMDSSLALIHYKDTQKLLRMGDNVTAVRLKVDDVIQASKIAAQIRFGLDGRFFVSDWTYTQGSLFKAVKMEKAMMFLLLTFIIAVAAFNIISTLVMVVTEKQSDIAILKTYGATPNTIMGIFMVQGGLNGVIGTAIGVLLGVLLSLNLSDFANWIESTLGISLLPGDVYFIDFLPSVMKWEDVYQVGGAALLMAFLATLYPSWRASRVKPAEALRYE
jgi:lipoprotein-releasing system permease protein